jgi:hypothetical protein
MKIGDLCTCTWQKGLHIYLGTGGNKGWCRVMSLETLEKCQLLREHLLAVKKCP